MDSRLSAVVTPAAACAAACAGSSAAAAAPSWGYPCRMRQVVDDTAAVRVDRHNLLDQLVSVATVASVC